MKTTDEPHRSEKTDRVDKGDEQVLEQLLLHIGVLDMVLFTALRVMERRLGQSGLTAEVLKELEQLQAGGHFLPGAQSAVQQYIHALKREADLTEAQPFARR